MSSADFSWRFLSDPATDSSNSSTNQVFSLKSGLDGLPLRVSNEGLPRPRVARAQETV
jgi:hypothetical protein